VLTINQHSINNKEIRGDDAESIWVSDDPETGDKYVALFNLKDNEAVKMKVSWSELGIKGKYKVRDLWMKKDKGSYSESLDLLVNPHGCVLLKLSKQK
jgi:hypothetical protein